MDYFVEGLGSSMECHLVWGLGVVLAIIPIIAYVPLD